jgi:RHS repeat-associated protein
VTRGTSTTEYLYQGSAIYGEYDPTWTTPLARYAHGPGVDQPLLRTTATGTQAFHPDGLGSIIGLTDTTGTLTAWTKYDPWGTVLSSSGTIPQYGYTGREPDGTGLIYYRARAYDPTLGRFTQRDPIGLAGGLNPYVYVGNNPVNFTDPTGEWTVGTVVGGVLGAIGGADVGYRLGGWSGATVGGLIGAGVGGAVGTINPTASSAISGAAVRMIIGGTVGGTTGVASALVTGRDPLVSGVIGAGVGVASAMPGVREGGAAVIGTLGNAANQFWNGGDLNPTSLWVAGASGLLGKQFSQVATSDVMGFSSEAAGTLSLLLMTPLSVGANWLTSMAPALALSDAEPNRPVPDILRDSYYSQTGIGAGDQSMRVSASGGD